ncbi:MAG: amidohydrolase family protein [Acidimicrobiales bacterium]
MPSTTATPASSGPAMSVPPRRFGSFWFCTLNDPSAMPQRHRIGVDRITFEVDYPHADTSWPDTQDRAHSLLADLPKDEAEMIAWRNASELFGHPVPAAVQADPEAFGQR